MKYFIVLFLILISIKTNSQSSFVLMSQGNSVNDFIPKNWRIINYTVGDLNKDSCEDIVLVIQEKDTANIVINTGGLGVDTLDSNPRILMILFKDSILGNYKLAGYSKTFILNHYSPTMDDPFDGIRIINGILYLGFHFWYSAGSWYSTSLDYIFRFQKNDFYLIGAEFEEIHRGTMDELIRSFNFSTKKMIQTKITYEIDKDNKAIEKSSIDTIKLDFKGLKTLKNLDRPLGWTLKPNIDI